MLSRDLIRKVNISTVFQHFKKGIRRIFYRVINKPIVNSFLSSILRILFRFKFIFETYVTSKKNTVIKSVKEFWIIYIGFVNKRDIYQYFNFDYYLSNKPFCCSNLRNLPFRACSCQMIYIKHFFKYFHHKKFNKVINSWKNKLIPGGTLKIQISLKKNEKKLEKLKSTLTKNNFFIKYIEDYDLVINGTITLICIKQKIIKKPSTAITSKKINELLLILKQNKNLFSKAKKICLLGYNLSEISNFIKGLNLDMSSVECFDLIDGFSNISDNYFDLAIVANFLEFYNFSDIKGIFDNLRRVVKPQSNILVIIPDKKNYYTNEENQLFNKGIFLKILDEYNLAFDWINLSSSLKMMQILIKNQDNFPLEKSNTKVLLIGVYSLRYTFLNNARWDSQARALEKLGYTIRILDIVDNSFNYLLKYLKIYKPDILWIGSKEAYSFLKENADFFRASNIKVIYWMWDITTFKPFNFKDVIDYLFITSQGEVPLYKKNFNLEKVYYMPVAIMPEIIRRNKFIKEKYDIGFSGQLNYTHPWYRERTMNLELIKKYYSVRIFTDIYHDLPELYSECRIVFGGTPYFKNLELYASNRPYIALGCGCCFITNYFKGLEKLAKNEHHLLWYNDNDELLALLKKYISNKDLREKIKDNAEKLAREKHNYMIRIKNMLDIINGNTNNFYGFLSE